MICTDFVPTVSNKPPANKKNKTGLIVGLAVGVAVVSFLSVFVVYYMVRRRRLRAAEEEGILESSVHCNRGIFQLSVNIMAIVYSDI